MTKYSCDIHTDNGWESIALFSDACALDAMEQFCTFQFELGNSLTTPADNIAIIDLDTGEVVWDWIGDSQDDLDYDEPANIDDDCGFDPYEGCFTFDC